MSDELVWEAPPERAQVSKYDGALEQVKKRMGDWARISTVSQGTAYGVRKRLMRKLTDERWEVVVRKTGEDDRHGVYVRYRSPEQMQAAKRS